jgi:hypothetical protein
MFLIKLIFISGFFRGVRRNQKETASAVFIEEFELKIKNG